ncbi:MAG: transposase [Gammaproteobacteria bacterium]|nr:transposase [Gammaproteobacteria bacterium]
MIGIDTAKNSLHYMVRTSMAPPVSRRRSKVLAFLKQQPPCLIALECCGGSHFWARAIQQLGHEVKLLPAAYVKPYVKRQKNDANDAAAIVEAASRVSMRGVAVKTREAQAHASLYRTRALYVRQRTQTANAIRSHLQEFGIVCGRGFAALEKVRIALSADPLHAADRTFYPST